MKGTYAHFDTIGCGREITGHSAYFVPTPRPLPIEHHETPPVTAGIVCYLNKQ